MKKLSVFLKTALILHQMSSCSTLMNKSGRFKARQSVNICNHLCLYLAHLVSTLRRNPKLRVTNYSNPKIKLLRHKYQEFFQSKSHDLCYVQPRTPLKSKPKRLQCASTLNLSSSSIKKSSIGSKRLMSSRDGSSCKSCKH